VTLNHWLVWLAAFLIVVGILVIVAAVQERRDWEREMRMAMDDDGNVAAEGRKAWTWGIIFAIAAVLALASMIYGARARDLGQWENSDPTIRNWYQTLMRPDSPSSSCCGEADAYWADEVHVKDGKTFATITDDRPDEPLGRPHIDVGTVIEIPPEKLKWDRSNPTGHGVLFVSKGLYAWCFVQGSGI
jgi:hypothetical protein